MKVVCINDRVGGISTHKDWLTQGKVYELTKPDVYEDKYWIISNKGKEVTIIKTRFKPLDEYRLEKIEEMIK